MSSTRHKPIEVGHWTPSRSYGLFDAGSCRDREGNIYAVSGEVFHDSIGIVRESISSSPSRPRIWYTSHAFIGGRNVCVHQERSGALSHRSLSIWLWRHAIPAMLAYIEQLENVK